MATTKTNKNQINVEPHIARETKVELKPQTPS